MYFSFYLPCEAAIRPNDIIDFYHDLDYFNGNFTNVPSVKMYVYMPIWHTSVGNREEWETQVSYEYEFDLDLDFNNYDYEYFYIDSAYIDTLVKSSLPGGYWVTHQGSLTEIVYNNQIYGIDEEIPIVSGIDKYTVRSNYKVVVLRDSSALSSLRFVECYETVTFYGHVKVVPPPESGDIVALDPDTKIPDLNLPETPVDYGNYYIYHYIPDEYERDRVEMVGNFLDLEYAGGKYTNIGSQFTITEKIVPDFLKIGKSYRITITDIKAQGVVHSPFGDPVPNFNSFLYGVGYAGKALGDGLSIKHGDSFIFDITVSDPTELIEIVGRGPVLFSGDSSLSGSQKVYWGINYKLYLQEIRNPTDLLVDDLSKDISEINDNITEINNRQIKNDELLDDLGDKASDDLVTRLNEYEEAENKVIDESLGVIDDIDFEGMTIESLPSGFLSAFVWTGAKLQEMFTLTEFSVIFPVIAIITLAIIIIGYWRFWK